MKFKFDTNKDFIRIFLKLEFQVFFLEVVRKILFIYYINYLRIISNFFAKKNFTKLKKNGNSIKIKKKKLFQIPVVFYKIYNYHLNTSINRINNKNIQNISKKILGYKFILIYHREQIADVKIYRKFFGRNLWIIKINYIKYMKIAFRLENKKWSFTSKKYFYFNFDRGILNISFRFLI
nr:cactin isoform X2 [Cryptomonas sp.]